MEVNVKCSIKYRNVIPCILLCFVHVKKTIKSGNLCIVFVDKTFYQIFIKHFWILKHCSICSPLHSISVSKFISNILNRSPLTWNINFTPLQCIVNSNGLVWPVFSKSHLSKTVNIGNNSCCRCNGLFIKPRHSTTPRTLIIRISYKLRIN